VLQQPVRRQLKPCVPGASTREIALQANVAGVTLFRHFTRKESLFAEVLCTFSSGPYFQI
jgi:hypothetical protein